MASEYCDLVVLKSSTVHRRLDAKFKIGSMEVADLLVVLILAAFMNLLFGRFSFAPVLVLGLPAILFGVLYIGKRAKPEGHLQHLVKYHLTTGELRALEEGLD